MLHVYTQILPQFQFAEEKNRLLRAVAGAGLDSLSSLRAKWDKLELVMESHQLMVKDQVTYTHTDTLRSAYCSNWFFRSYFPQNDSFFFMHGTLLGGGDAKLCGQSYRCLQGRSGAV